MARMASSTATDLPILTDAEAEARVRAALGTRDWRGQKVLLVIPDLTRGAPVPLFYRILCDLLDKPDTLVALGTHQPLSIERFCQRVGLDEDEFQRRGTVYFNHEWDNPKALRHIGTIPAEDVQRLTAGLCSESVPVRVNARLFNYDHVMVLGPVFPHEVAGFSGGNKYFFPGVAGEELIHMFHWLGALLTNPEIIGRMRTPVRSILDRAAEFLPMPRTYLHLVVHHGQLHGLFIGDAIEAWERAARMSAQLNIRYVPRPYRRVLGIASKKYDDVWTAGKVVYKSEPVVADGGEVIVYAPHITQVSVTHGTQLEAVGYHVRDYFTAQPERFAHVPGAIRAHSTHVRGIGTYLDGVEHPRIAVTLATGIPEATCRRINLGYCDPATLDPQTWANQEDMLLIPDAGEVLYRVGEGPTD
jgi:nickel-dependent lactate racemase